MGGAQKKPRADFFNPHAVDKDLDAKFHEALIEHITETCTSFAQYGESFQNVINVISKRVKVKHPNTLSRMVDNDADKVLKEVTSIFRTVKEDLVSLGFTSDLWTSRALHSYISLTISFIDRFVILIILLDHPNFHDYHIGSCQVLADASLDPVCPTLSPAPLGLHNRPEAGLDAGGAGTDGP